MRSYSTREGLIRTALRLSNTVATSVFQSGSFWFFLLVHLLVFCSVQWHRSASVMEGGILSNFLIVEWRGVKVVTGITTFIEVFYTQQSYTRYMHLYNLMREMFRKVYDVCHFVRVFAGDTQRGYSRLSTRYIVASVALMLQVLKDEATDANLLRLGRLELLRPKEVAALVCLNPVNRSRVVMSWASAANREALEDSNAPKQVLQAVTDYSLYIQRMQRKLIETMTLPVPVQYFHLLNSMVLMNLMMWAITMGLLNCLWAPVIYCFSSFIFIGMLELSSELSDPFGTDEVDFPVDDWVRACMGGNSYILEAEWPYMGRELEDAAEEEPNLKKLDFRKFSVLHAQNRDEPGARELHLAGRTD